MALNRFSFLKKLAIALATAAFWVAVWGLFDVLLDKPLFLPTPWAVAEALFRLAPTGDFWRTMAFSLLRVVAGYLPGVALGAVCGIITAKVKLLDLLFAPFLTVIRATPVASFIMLAVMLLGRYIRGKALCRALQILCAVIIGVTVIGRLISGVHWFTDIIGGILISAALLALFSEVKNG